MVDSQSQAVSRKEQSCLEINVKINYRNGVDRIQVWSNLGKSYTVKNKNDGTLYYVDECLNPMGCYLLELRGSFEYTIDNIKNEVIPFSICRQYYSVETVALLCVLYI